jgi:hypothetical protein
MDDVTAAAVLPSFFARWMDGLLPGAIPDEARATCSNCAMVATNDSERASGRFFGASAKCCTHIPTLANYQVGGVLVDESDEARPGRDGMLARLRAGDGATPLGIAPPRRLAILSDAATPAFGNNTTLLCPHFRDVDGGLCGIWRHRNSTCTTWFCKFNRGAVGLAFWTSLQQLLAALEQELSWWAVLELNPGADAVRRLLALRSKPANAPLQSADVDGTAKADARSWGSWLGREEEFYVEAAKRVGTLTWDDALAICGPTVRVAAAVVRTHYDELLSTDVPERLTGGSFTIVSLDALRATVSSYRTTDPLSMPRTVLDVIGEFDGSPTPDVLERVSKTRGLRVAPSLVRKLVDYGILKAAE